MSEQTDNVNGVSQMSEAVGQVFSVQRSHAHRRVPYWRTESGSIQHYGDNKESEPSPLGLSFPSQCRPNVSIIAARVGDPAKVYMIGDRIVRIHGD